MWPALRTLANTTLPKLPSPISLRTSNLSSNATALIMGVDDPRWVKSCATVMAKVLVVESVVDLGIDSCLCCGDRIAATDWVGPSKLWESYAQLSGHS